MSLSSVNAALDDLLAGDTPQAVALKGEWGRGKSYFWRTYLVSRGARISRLKTYSYVSLFSLDSLGAVKEAIFANAEALELTGAHGQGGTGGQESKRFWHRAQKVAHSATKYTDLIKLIPHAGELGALVHTAAFGTVKDYLICIDDLERRPAGLGLRDVLGLVAMLRDQRDCRVVVIVNSDALRSDSDKDFELLREKVFDYEVAFEPSAAECADIALPDKDYERPRRLAESLKITNIRVLLRAKRLLKTLQPFAKNAGERIQAQIDHSGVLLAWCFNSRAGDAPPYEYVKNLNYTRLLELDPSKVSDDQKRWNELLWEYGFKATDALDLEICRTLERGFVDPEALVKILEEQAATDRRGALENNFHRAWEIYHNGFGDDAHRLAEAFSASMREGAQFISAMNASAAVGLLRELSQEALADELTTVWIAAQLASNPGELNIAESVWQSDIRDAKFRDAAQAAFASLKADNRPIGEVLMAIVERSGWSESDVCSLAAASPDDYYALFKATSGPQIKSIVRAALRFGELASSPAYVKIGADAREALLRIASESQLDARRVRAFLAP